MGRYVFVVYSNPVEGREQEYNDWYWNQHLSDLLACPGIIAARRLMLADRQVRDMPQPFKYLALYEIETNDLQGFIDELVSRATTGRMARSAALSNDSLPVFWRVLQE
jgi:hypothetical protein